MVNTILVLEAVNLWVGQNEEGSKHITLTSLALPTFEETVVDHKPGGSRFAIQLGMGMFNALETTFKLAGYDPQIQSLIGEREIFNVYGVLRDKRTSTEIQVRSVFHALLNKVAPGEYQRGELQDHDHSLSEILHYESYFNGAEKHYFDFFNASYRVDGVSKNATQRSMLRIPGVA